MELEIIYYNEKAQQNILRFPPVIQARYFNLTDRMQKFGPHLGMPHTRALGDGLFELRMKAKEGIGRVFFCTLTRRKQDTSVNRKIVILHSFVKKARKTPGQERDTARKRLLELRGT
ncbi:MAG: type II toxin-antitoxin system RelE/ParE family toxin [Gemmatimonadota bacterium]|nr:type II toxin-antitoxin system RelE/ParE family toxin [Gemmatimonadota bacterium]